MLIATANDDSTLADRYLRWCANSDKPISWEAPMFEIEIHFGANGCLLYAWKKHRLTFRAQPLDYYQLDYCSSVRFWDISRRMDREALRKRYRSEQHANQRWFDLICQAYDYWWEAGKPEEFRFIA
jgi:hypothetical protein